MRKDDRQFSKWRLWAGLVGALALAWGLVGAPLHHQLVKLQSAKPKPRPPSHHHGAPARPDHDHGGQSLEHGQVAAELAPSAPELRLVLAELLLASPTEPDAPFRAAWRTAEQPQGP